MIVDNKLQNLTMLETAPRDPVETTVKQSRETDVCHQEARLDQQDQQDHPDQAED